MASAYLQQVKPDMTVMFSFVSTAAWVWDKEEVALGLYFSWHGGNKRSNRRRLSRPLYKSLKESAMCKKLLRLAEATERVFLRQATTIYSHSVINDDSCEDTTGCTLLSLSLPMRVWLLLSLSLCVCRVGKVVAVAYWCWEAKGLHTALFFLLPFYKRGCITKTLH